MLEEKGVHFYLGSTIQQLSSKWQNAEDHIHAAIVDKDSSTSMRSLLKPNKPIFHMIDKPGSFFDDEQQQQPKFKYYEICQLNFFGKILCKWASACWNPKPGICIKAAASLAPQSKTLPANKLVAAVSYF